MQEILCIFQTDDVPCMNHSLGCKSVHPSPFIKKRVNLCCHECVCLINQFYLQGFLYSAIRKREDTEGLFIPYQIKGGAFCVKSHKILWGKIHPDSISISVTTKMYFSY